MVSSTTLSLMTDFGDKEEVSMRFAISNGETFSVIHNTSSEHISGYNFIIIPEAG